MVTIPSAGSFPKPEPEEAPKPPPEPPQIVPRCCLYCDLTITFDDSSKTWRILHQRDNLRLTERTFADEKIEEAMPWLETLHA